MADHGRVPLLSTDEVPPRERAPVLARMGCRLFGGLESDLYGDTEFDGHLAASHAGDVILTRLEANRHRVMRSRRRWRAQRGRLPEDRRALARLRRRRAEGPRGLGAPGELEHLRHHRHYAVANPERCEHLIVMLPKEQLAERGLPLGELMARRLGGASGISRVALETMRNTYRELPEHERSCGARRGRADHRSCVRLSLLELAGQDTPR